MPTELDRLQLLCDSGNGTPILEFTALWICSGNRWSLFGLCFAAYPEQLVP